MSFLMTSRCFSSSVSYYLYFYSLFLYFITFQTLNLCALKKNRYSHLIHVRMNTVEVRVKIYVKIHQIARTWAASRGLFFDLIMILI